MARLLSVSELLVLLSFVVWLASAMELRELWSVKKRSKGKKKESYTMFRSHYSEKQKQMAALYSQELEE